MRASVATALRMRRKNGVVASTHPVTRIRIICMENDSKLQKPSPQCTIIARGVCVSKPIPARNTTTVSSSTKMKGSCSQQRSGPS